MSIFLILLEILKFTLLFIFIILSIVILITGLILFIPFNWSVKLDKYDNFGVYIRCRWLFGMLNFEYLQNKAIIRILGIDLSNKLYNKSTTEQKDKQEDSTSSSNTEESSKNNIKEENNIDEMDKLEHEHIEDNTDKIDDTKHEHSENNTKNAKPKKKLINKFKKTKKSPKHDKQDHDNQNENKPDGFISNILDKYKWLKESFEYYNNILDIKAIIACTKTLAIKILKALAPRKIEGKLEIGLSEPHLTGYVLATLSAINSFVPVDIQTKAVFDRETLSGSIYTNGKLYIYKLVAPFISYVFAKPIRQVIKLLYKKIMH